MLDVLSPLPADPILGLSAAFQQDTNPNKIDLGVGVYRTEDGQTPIMAAIAEAQRRLLATETSKTYIAPRGVAGYVDGLLELLLGPDSALIHNKRLAAVQAPGGCGALRILAELLKRCNANTTVWVSDPTWANHIPLMKSAGLQLQTYPYFDKAKAGIDFDAMLACLQQVQKGDVVLLHGCCHNPTGADLTQEQWQQVLTVAQEREFLPFIDIAYLGFGDGLEQDAYGLRLLAENLPEVIIAASCSKNFGLYRERTGLAVMVGKNADSAAALQTQIQSVARESYSMPPAYGGALVDIVLNDTTLKQQWQQEVAAMRERMQSLRAMLVEKLNAKGADGRFDFVTAQKGMFSFLCISPEQVRAMREQHGVYFVDSSRVNIAGINQHNVDYLAQALMAVL